MHKCVVTVVGTVMVVVVGMGATGMAILSSLEDFAPAFGVGAGDGVLDGLGVPDGAGVGVPDGVGVLDGVHLADFIRRQ